MYRFYGMTVEQIREELKNLPPEDPEVVANMQFTGSGMTEHGFMISSACGWIVTGPDPDHPGCVKCRPAEDEAELIYTHINMWKPDGTRRE